MIKFAFLTTIDKATRKVHVLNVSEDMMLQLALLGAQGATVNPAPALGVLQSHVTLQVHIKV